MYTFLKNYMANGKPQVPFQVGKTICQLVSAAQLTLRLLAAFRTLAEELLHIYCLWCYMHIEQIALHSEFLKWLSKRNSLQYSCLKSSVFDWLSWGQLEIYQIIHFLTQDQPLRAAVQVLRDGDSPFFTWNIRFWFLISKTWDYMLCLSFPLLDCRSQMEWIQTATARRERFGILNYQEVKEEQKL